MNIPLKSLVSVWTQMAIHFNTSTKSIQTLQNRASIRFLTIDMPSLGKALDQALETGSFVLPPFFKRKDKGTQLPAFLYEFFSELFYSDGTIRDFDPALLSSLRQLLYVFYKLEQPFETHQIDESFKGFIDRDSIVKTDYTESQITALKAIIEGENLTPYDPTDIVPVYSGGKTSDSYGHFERRSTFRINNALAPLVPLMFHNRMHASIAYPGRLSPAKLTCVPKDSRGPRIICMEPHENMYIQKGIQNLWYDHIEDKHLCDAAGFVNFTDQTVNQRLAYLASIDRSLATIDLKDASDMVSLELVKRVFSGTFLELLLRCRSTHYKADGTVYEFKKFAPMGSALCFPVEAVIFYSIVRTVSPYAYVYGDDIIVPTEFAHQVIDVLTQYGMIVNKSKTLINGYFRESCGSEYYRGHDISYVKFRSDSLVSLSMFTHLVNARHGPELAEALTSVLEQYQMLPRSTCSEQSLLTYYHRQTTPNDVFFKRRYNSHLHRYEYKSLSVRNENGLRDSSIIAYVEWLQRNCGLRPNDRYAIQNSFNDVLNPRGTPSVFHRVGHKLTYKWDTLV